MLPCWWNCAETEIARSEVELLVVERIVGDVHLAVDAGDVIGRGTRVVEHGGGVVVEAGGAALEEDGDQRDFLLRGRWRRGAR